MDLELVTIGTELVLGDTIDTNAAHIARALASVGARVVRKTTVPDELEPVTDALRMARTRTGFVIATGGLGPTRDDVTKRAAAELYRAPLELDAAYLASLEERWRRLGRRGPMPAANRTQAEVPRGATVLPNPRGTAPGLWLEDAEGVVVLLPGVPHEMAGLLRDEVSPRVAARAGSGRVTASRVLRTTGVAESALADLLGPVEAELAPLTLAYLPSFEGVDLRLTAWDVPAAQGEADLARAGARLRSALGDACYGEGDADLAGVVLAQARARGARVAVAESCTGGLLGARLTAVPGASAVFVGGVIAYDDRIKLRDLEVPADLLAEHGAVSEAVVRAMAAGVRRRYGVEAGVAVSGIAGPDGGSAEKPVGTVWLATDLGDGARALRLGLPGDRTEIRARAAQAALDLLRRLLGAPVEATGLNSPIAT